MKPFDLYQHFHKFCEMLDNEQLSIDTRLGLGREWLRSLPASMMCIPYELSRDLVFKEMKGRLDAKENKYGRGNTKASETAQVVSRPIQAQQPTETGAEPVRQDATDGGGKATVEDLDRPKVPKAKRQGAGKA